MTTSPLPAKLLELATAYQRPKILHALIRLEAPTPTTMAWSRFGGTRPAP